MKKVIAMFGRYLLSCVCNTSLLSRGMRYFCVIPGVAVVFLGTSFFPAASVQAQEVEGRVCSMSGNLYFDGPLSKQDGDHEVIGEATISACVDGNGPIAEAGAEVLFTGGGIANCTLQSFTLAQLVEWNDGQLDFVTLHSATGERAPLGAYKGTVDFGMSGGQKVITTLFNKEPLQTLSCLLGVEPMGVYTFNGVQIFTDLDADTEL